MRPGLLTVALLALGAVAGAQGAPVPSPSPSPSPSPAGPRLTFSGQVRIRPEYRTTFASSGDGNLTVLQRTRLGLTAKLPRATAVIEVQDARNWGTEQSTTSNDRNVDLHQAFVRVPELAGGRLALTVGRQELAYGDERLVGALDWATTARSFDAGLLRWGFKSGSADVFAAIVEDGNASGRDEGNQVFAGAYSRLLRNRKDLEVDAYVLHLDDDRPAQVGGDLRITTFGARARRLPARGLQASGEVAVQRGRRGGNDQRAEAFAAWAGYAFSGRLAPVLRLEVDHASGDGDPNDGEAREFHNLFPTNHPYYGYADLLGWRNMRVVKLGVTVTPAKKHTLGVDLLDLALADERGPWKDAGGAVLFSDPRQPPGSSGTDIGRELDVLWRFPLHDDVGALVGYSVLFPGDVARRQTRRERHFAYAHLLLRF